MAEYNHRLKVTDCGAGRCTLRMTSVCPMANPVFVRSPLAPADKAGTEYKADGSDVPFVEALRKVGVHKNNKLATALTPVAASIVEGEPLRDIFECRQLHAQAHDVVVQPQGASKVLGESDIVEPAFAPGTTFETNNGNLKVIDEPSDPEVLCGYQYPDNSDLGSPKFAPCPLFRIVRLRGDSSNAGCQIFRTMQGLPLALREDVTANQMAEGVADFHNDARLVIEANGGMPRFKYEGITYASEPHCTVFHYTPPIAQAETVVASII